MVVKLCLKSLQEFVRLQTFNRSGFQQIQLDIQFLRNPVKEIVEDEAAFDFLLDEVIGKCFYNMRQQENSLLGKTKLEFLQLLPLISSYCFFYIFLFFLPRKTRNIFLFLLLLLMFISFSLNGWGIFFINLLFGFGIQAQCTMIL